MKKKSKSQVNKRNLSIKYFNFKGSYFVLIGMFFLGIFLPPIMSMTILYFVQRILPKQPKLFDRNLLIFSSSLFLLWIVSLMFSGVNFSDAVSKSLIGGAFVMIIVYPFVFAWLYFDWNYRGTRV